MWAAAHCRAAGSQGPSSTSGPAVRRSPLGTFIYCETLLDPHIALQHSSAMVAGSDTCTARSQRGCHPGRALCPIRKCGAAAEGRQHGPYAARRG